MAWGFEVGRTYNRQRDIHDRFQGQQRNGIITPAEHALVIIVSGDEGQEHGYSDRLREDGVFEYFGAGQIGDMAFVRGNKALRDHAANGKDLLVFKSTAKGLRFDGYYVCENYHWEKAPDRQGTMRNAIVFELRPLEAIVESVTEQDNSAGDIDLSELRARALEAASSEPKQGKRTTTIFDRSRIIRNYILARAKGRCEDCGELAPFETPSGIPFLEVHHIRRMTDGGPDDPRFMIGLCPNCHRRAHYGRDAKVRNEEMLTYVKAIEQQ
jgi:5-methylcytosine-specific restriction protein A